MTYQELLLEYTKQYPEDESPMAYNFIFGEDVIMDFLKNREGRRIGIFFKDSSDDRAELIYL